MSAIESITIRDVINEDREQVLKVLLAAYGQYEQVLPADKWELYRQSIIASFDQEGPEARIVAEADNTIVGSVQLFVSSAAAYGAPELGITGPIIRYLAVSPDQRGRGVATALIRESIKRSLRLGAEWLNLHTSDMMASAVSLYERLGFERAYDTDVQNGEILVKGYRINLKSDQTLQI
ncbi:GNAT family N-acetyltransferase [Paenibacillus albus]|uniref:GNAT family N-acetyltransferase n=1 Tax=Paenibacillus albus TaxID=2495582 RepID=A0A3S9AAQ9_9BACL|nr:GNAT family N-acetyltransferase [Paenibacillus albus]AZN42815.1 GNAT family N-acetyltransferase [Paenibacillus albus]